MMLIHILTRNKGSFIKRYYVPMYGDMVQIKLADGRVYYAPAYEFIEI